MSGFKYIESNRTSKAQKRRDVKAAKKAEQLKRIEDCEKQDEHIERRVEQEQLIKLLEKDSLRIHDIAADGDCLFRAVEHQLSIASDANERLSYSQLRKKTGQYMLENPENFLPFLLNDRGDLMNQSDFEDYCSRVANTKDWGGHLELTAISEITGKSIRIYQARSTKPIVIEPTKGSNTEPILLSFHKHLYHLGEHYNSLIK